MHRLAPLLAIVVLALTSCRESSQGPITIASQRLDEIGQSLREEAEPLWRTLLPRTAAGEDLRRNADWTRWQARLNAEIDRWLGGFTATGPRADLLRARAYNMIGDGARAEALLTRISSQAEGKDPAFRWERIKALAQQQRWPEVEPLLEQAEVESSSWPLPGSDPEEWTLIRMAQALGDPQSGGEAAQALLTRSPHAEWEAYRPAWVAAGALTFASRGRQVEAHRLCDQGLSRLLDPPGMELKRLIGTQIDLIGKSMPPVVVDHWLTAAPSVPAGRTLAVMLALDCPHCLDWLRALQASVPRLRTRGVEVVAYARLTGHAGARDASARKTLDEAGEIAARKEQMRQLGITLPVGISRDGIIQQDLAVTFLPVCFLSESDQRISRITLGALAAPRAVEAVIGVL